MENSNQNSLSSEENTLRYQKGISKVLCNIGHGFCCVYFVIGSAYFYLRYAPRIYESTAKIKILDENEGLELPTAGYCFNRSNINLGNEIEILTSYIILEKVVKRLNLTSEIYEIGRIQTLSVTSTFLF